MVGKDDRWPIYAPHVIISIRFYPFAQSLDCLQKSGSKNIVLLGDGEQCQSREYREPNLD